MYSILFDIHPESDIRTIMRKRNPLTIQRRQDIGSKEDRWLFGKTSWSIVEKKLIHRAYIFGQTSIHQILHMNATEKGMEMELFIFHLCSQHEEVQFKRSTEQYQIHF